MRRAGADGIPGQGTTGTPLQAPGRPGAAGAGSPPTANPFDDEPQAEPHVQSQPEPPAEPAGPVQPLPAAATAPAPGVDPAPTGDAVPLELELTANQQGYDSQLQRFVATGSVMARLAGGRLLADRLEFEASTRTLLAVGNVRFQRGQQYLQGSRLRYALLEGVGEIDDVYGVIDLDSTQEDFDLEQAASTPLPPPEPISCTPSYPAVPQWQPYPWAVTTWAGQMYAGEFGDTFTFSGRFRPEYLGGSGCSAACSRQARCRWSSMPTCWGTRPIPSRGRLQPAVPLLRHPRPELRRIHRWYRPATLAAALAQRLLRGGPERHHGQEQLRADLPRELGAPAQLPGL